MVIDPRHPGVLSEAKARRLVDCVLMSHDRAMDIKEAARGSEKQGRETCRPAKGRT